MKARAFTILELMVTVTIIVILISLLLPATEMAISAAGLARCTANLRAIGQALNGYTSDSQDSYPHLGNNSQNWHALLGSPGTYAGVFLDSDARPLNPYLGFTGKNAQVTLAQCPADRGDSLVGSQNAYKDWGTSYIAYIVSYFGIRAPFAVGAQQPMRASQVRPSPHNKVLVPDWSALGNREYGDPAILNNRWHRLEPDPVTRYHNVLFGDSHVELYGFNRAVFEATAGAQDPDGAWW